MIKYDDLFIYNCFNTKRKTDKTLKYETLKTGLIKEKDYDKIVNPKKMIYPS